MTKYTIFALWNDFSERHGKLCFFPPLPGEPGDLAGRIQYARNFGATDNFIPVAWVGGEGCNFGNYEEACHEAIAAGRYIEPVDGRYVARGMTPTLDKLEAEKEQQPMNTPLFDHLRRLRESGQGPAAIDPNARMIASDDTPAAHEWLERQMDAYLERQNLFPTSTTKPPIPGLTRMSAQGHRLGLGRSFSVG